jgi:hypothetical protein
LRILPRREKRELGKSLPPGALVRISQNAFSRPDRNFDFDRELRGYCGAGVSPAVFARRMIEKKPPAGRRRHGLLGNCGESHA